MHALHAPKRAQLGVFSRRGRSGKEKVHSPSKLTLLLESDGLAERSGWATGLSALGRVGRARLHLLDHA
jgi:hypothetical protein